MNTQNRYHAAMLKGTYTANIAVDWRFCLSAGNQCITFYLTFDRNQRCNQSSRVWQLLRWLNEDRTSRSLLAMSWWWSLVFPLLLRGKARTMLPIPVLKWRSPVESLIHLFHSSLDTSPSLALYSFFLSSVLSFILSSPSLPFLFFPLFSLVYFQMISLFPLLLLALYSVLSLVLSPVFYCVFLPWGNGGLRPISHPGKWTCLSIGENTQDDD